MINSLENSRLFITPIQPHILMKEQGSVTNNVGESLTHLWKSYVHPEMITKIISTTEKLSLVNKPKIKDTSRGFSIFYTMGTWKYRTTKPVLIEDRKGCEVWMKDNTALFDHIALLYREAFREEYEKYMSVSQKQKSRVFGPWYTLNININYACLPHTDKNDYLDGYCWIIPFGNWTNGGCLLLDDFGVQIDVQPGDVVALKSAKIKHSVTKYEGVRNFLVLFTQHTMFTHNYQ